MGMTEEMHREQTKKENKYQRVIVFQGGAALGAYEAGCYKELYHWIKSGIEDDKENVFDIIAGTSVGAINASILASYVKERREKEGLGILESWKGSAEKLEEFWKDMQSITVVEANPLFSAGWESLGMMRKIGESWLDAAIYFYSKINPYFNDQFYKESKEYFDIPASSEAARRYYSVKEFQRRGANHVFSPLPFGIPEYFWPLSYISPTIALPKLDYRFLDNSRNLLFRYTNQPLRKILENYIKFPLATNYHDDKGQEIKEPRLLVVSIDVQDGSTVTFDSYPYVARECSICNEKFEDLIKHVYQDHGIPYHHEKLFNEQEDPPILRWSVYGDDINKYCISYSEGIQLKHIIASASVPIIYDYEQINATKFDFDNVNIDSDQARERGYGPGAEGKQNKKGQTIVRYFWDGQYLSNTPLRELFGAHTIFWKGKFGEDALEKNILSGKRDKKEKEDELHIPDLEIYIANLWPKKEEAIPYDHDGLVDRKNDITFHDKSEYDEKVAEFVTDYIDLARKLIKFAEAKGLSKKEIEKEVLGKEASSRFRSGKKRKFEDLLIGRFDVKKAVRIERTDDPDAISEKWGDYSYRSIGQLFEQGRKDVLRTLIEEEIVKVINDEMTNTEKKRLLLEPLREAIYELTRPGASLEQVIVAYESIKSKFIKEVEKQNNNIHSDLKKTAQFIAGRLDPPYWHQENL